MAQYTLKEFVILAKKCFKAGCQLGWFSVEHGCKVEIYRPLEMWRDSENRLHLKVKCRMIPL